MLSGRCVGQFLQSSTQPVAGIAHLAASNRPHPARLRSERSWHRKMRCVLAGVPAGREPLSRWGLYAWSASKWPLWVVPCLLSRAWLSER